MSFQLRPCCLLVRANDGAISAQPNVRTRTDAHLAATFAVRAAKLTPLPERVAKARSAAAAVVLTEVHLLSMSSHKRQLSARQHPTRPTSTSSIIGTSLSLHSCKSVSLAVLEQAARAGSRLRSAAGAVAALVKKTHETFQP